MSDRLMRQRPLASLILAALLVACGGGGGGSDDALTGSGAVNPAPAGNVVAAPAPSSTADPDVLALVINNLWYQKDFEVPSLGSRVDALYNFKSNGTGTLQRIRISGSNIFPINDLNSNFRWSLAANVLTLLRNDVVGQVGGSSNITLVRYLRQTDQLEVVHDARGPAVWDGCGSPNRPGNGTLLGLVFYSLESCR